VPAVPNQVLAIRCRTRCSSRDRWEPVMKVVRERLLTPAGLRSLAPGEPDYKARYYGDLRARDAAYHQGTVWAWLIGPYSTPR
jgi:predicted glycogen debranching enzyme